MRAVLPLLFGLWLTGCELWFGGGYRQPVDGAGAAASTDAATRPGTASRPRIPLHPELERSQLLLSRAMGQPTGKAEFMSELQQAQTLLDEAIQIWIEEKGRLDADDEEWQALHHLNHLARQHTAIAVMKARGLDARRELAGLQTPGAEARKSERVLQPMAQPPVAAELPLPLRELRPRQGERGLILTLDARYFVPGEATLINGEPLLEALAEYLVANPGMSIACEGHSGSDDAGASGQQLSQQRARALQQGLLERGLEFSRITAVGYGSTRPLVRDGVTLGHSARVEIVLSDTAPPDYGAVAP